MTQMGFVTMVLLPPAIMEDQKLITMLLSTSCQHAGRMKVDRARSTPMPQATCQGTFHIL